MKTILLIANDPAILRLGQQVLGDAGYAAESVSDPEEARAKLKETPYNGIVLDLAVPGRNGHGFAASIGELDANRHTPLIIVAADEPDGRKRAFDAGAMAFLPKPFTTEAFRAVIHTVISPAGPRPRTAPRRSVQPSASGLPRPAAPSPPPVPPAPPVPRDTAADGAIAVSFQDGPIYWCEPAPDGGWRCGRCELGVVPVAEIGNHCTVCHAAVVPEPAGHRPGLGWLLLLFLTLLVLGWAVLQWWPSLP